MHRRNSYVTRPQHSNTGNSESNPCRRLFTSMHAPLADVRLRNIAKIKLTRRTQTRNSRPHMMARGQHFFIYIENAATYIEGKDTPEATRDKERLFTRYTFKVNTLSRIFKGSLPDDEKGANIRERRQHGRRIYVASRST